MSDDLLPPEQLFKLCKATTINQELLVKFVDDDMILDSDCERIMAHGSNFDKACNFYNLLKRQTSKEKPQIIRNLKSTGNKKAASIIEGTDISAESSTSFSFTQKESPFVLDASTLPNGHGAIIFDGDKMSLRRRRFWVLEKAGTIRFTMESNELKPGSRITISGFKITQDDDCLDEVYIEPSTPNRTELTVSGVVILITLTINNTDGKEFVFSSFVLRFLRKQNEFVLGAGRIVCPSTFVMGEGRQKASFPENNEADYPNNANHFMLISPASGWDFSLSLKFLDIVWNGDNVRMFLIDDQEDRTKFINHGKISGDDADDYSEWEHCSAAVLFFTSNGSEIGKGYKFKIRGDGPRRVAHDDDDDGSVYQTYI